MNRSLIYYMELQEGKKLDKLKKHWKKHKGKYLLGAATTAGLGVLEYGGDKLQRSGVDSAYKRAREYNKRGDSDRKKYRKETTPDILKVVIGDKIKPSSWVKNITRTSTRKERFDKLSNEYANKYNLSTKTNVPK